MRGVTVLAVVAGFLLCRNLLAVSAKGSNSFVWGFGERCERELLRTMPRKRRIECVALRALEKSKREQILVHSRVSTVTAMRDVDHSVLLKQAGKI